MKIKKERLREIIKEEISKVHHNTSLMEDMFTEEEKQAFTEMASLSRVKGRIEDEMVPFVMISAFRGGLSRKENLKRQKQLEARFKAGDFTWNKMPGSGYVEKPERIPLAYNEVKENSILVWAQNDKGELLDPKSLFNLASEGAREFNQDSFIFGAPEEMAGKTSMGIRVYDQSGGLIKEPWAGPWYNIQQAADDDFYWSVIGSKRTKLTELEDKYSSMRAGSFMGAVKKDYYHKAAKSGLKWIDNKEQG